MYSEANYIQLSKANEWQVDESTPTLVDSAADETYGAHFLMTDRDSRYVVAVTNTSANTAALVTLMTGDGPQATPYSPSVSLAAGQTAYIQLESGGYKHLSAHAALGCVTQGFNTMERVFIRSTSAAVAVRVIHTVL